MRLICGNTNEVTNITETKRCHYDIVFASHLFCGVNHVYTHLDEIYRKKWDLIETNYRNKELTDLGYQSFLNDLFIETGLRMNNSTQLINNKDFDNKEFIKLKKENLYLKQQLENLQNKTII